jgi:c-di-GMP-binding flagellar brake protein YcgR
MRDFDLQQPELTNHFDTAIAKNALAVVSVKKDDGWKVIKSRLLERDSACSCFVLDYQNVNDRPWVQLYKNDQVGISFRSQSKKVLFPSAVKAVGNFRCNSGPIPAVSYCWPQRAMCLSRRSYYATEIPDDIEMAVKIYNAQQQLVISGFLADLSCGGALIRCTSFDPQVSLDSANLHAEIQVSEYEPTKVDVINVEKRKPQGLPCG